MKPKPTPYQNQQYKPWLTLPPQIPIPYNDSHLHILSLKISNLDYINTYHRPNKNHPESDTSKPKQQLYPFKLKTYWWGQDTGYQSLLKTIVLNQKPPPPSSSENIPYTPNQTQTNFNIKPIDTVNQVIYEPIKFLVCCPLDNFLKYCFDMRVLKIQLFSVQMNSVIAKSYINFLTLNNCWKGEPIPLSIPLFAPSFNLQTFNGTQYGKNTKIIGQIRLQMVLERVLNPYKALPQRPNDGSKLSKIKLLKQNFDNSNEFYTGSKPLATHSKKPSNVQGESSFEQHPQGQEYIVDQNTLNKGKKQNMINYHNFENDLNYRRHKDIVLKAQKQRQQIIENIYSHNPQKHTRVTNFTKKYGPNYQSEKMRLHEDFKMVFGIKNPLYSSFFKDQTRIKEGKNHKSQVQTIEFHLRVVLEPQMQQKGIFFDHVNVLVPVMGSGKDSKGWNQRLNEYRIFQEKGIVKIQFETGESSTQDIENFIKQGVVSVEVIYQKRSVKEEKKTIKVQEEYSQKGSIGLLPLLASCGVQNRVNLGGDKKISRLGDCYIVAVSAKDKHPQSQTNNNEASQSETKKKLKRTKQVRIEQKQQLVWLKIDKFIPLNHTYYRQANIYVKINLIQTTKKAKPPKNNFQRPKEIPQKSKTQLKQIGQTSTLWKPFGQINHLIAHFKNQSITFPILNAIKKKSYKNLKENEFELEDSEEEEEQWKQISLSIEVWNRQKSNVRIGSGVVVLSVNNEEKQVRGRIQVEIKDIRKEVVGFVEIWCEKGEIGYINSLMSSHGNNLGKSFAKENEKFQQHVQIKQETNKNIKKPESNKRIEQNKHITDKKQEQQRNDQGQRAQTEQFLKMQESSHNQDKQNESGEELKQFGVKKFIKLSESIQQKVKNTSGNDRLVLIHNQLSYALLMILHHTPEHSALSDYLEEFNYKSLPNEQMDEDQIQDENEENKIFMDPNQFYLMVLYIFRDETQNISVEQLKNHSKTNKSLSQPQWMGQIIQFYRSKNPRSFSYQSVNFSDIQSSLQAYGTYYDQIIESKNHSFWSFKKVLNQASIQVQQIEDALQERFLNDYKNLKGSSVPNKNGGKLKEKIEFMAKTKQIILSKLGKLLRANQSILLQIQTIVQNLLSFYSQRALNLSNYQQAINLCNIICDQVRKYQLYETTYQTPIQSEAIKLFISQNIREILEIDYYIDASKLIQNIQQNYILLTKWELIHLSDTYSQKHHRNSPKSTHQQVARKQKVLSRDPSRERIIVKSPTFGLLEQVHSNRDPGSKEKLFKTSPLQQNPSIVHNMGKYQVGNLKNQRDLKIESGFGINEEKKESENSFILKKRIEMISPISNNIDISNEISSAVNNPSSMIFQLNQHNYNSVNSNHQSNNYNSVNSNNYNSVNANNYQSNKEGRRYGNHERDQILEVSYNNNQSSSDCLTVIFVHLKAKVLSIKCSKSTYFPEESHLNSIGTQNENQSQSINQISRSIPQHEQEKSHSHVSLNPHSQIQNSLSLNQQSKLKSNQNQANQVHSPSMIKLYGIQIQRSYNLELTVSQFTNSSQLDPQEVQILVNCQHGCWEKIIDQKGQQIGSLMVCLTSELRSDQSQANGSSYIRQ